LSINGLHNPVVLLLRALLSTAISVAQQFVHGAYIHIHIYMQYI
jgi:hypothetical protein